MFPLTQLIATTEDFKDIHGFTLLNYAAKLDRLLKDGFCNPFSEDAFGRSPLQLAVISNCEEAALELLAFRYNHEYIQFILQQADNIKMYRVVNRIIEKYNADHSLDLQQLKNYQKHRLSFKTNQTVTLFHQAAAQNNVQPQPSSGPDVGQNNSNLSK